MIRNWLLISKFIAADNTQTCCPESSFSKTLPSRSKIIERPVSPRAQVETRLLRVVRFTSQLLILICIQYDSIQIHWLWHDMTLSINACIYKYAMHFSRASYLGRRQLPRLHLPCAAQSPEARAWILYVYAYMTIYIYKTYSICDNITYYIYY